MGLVEFIRRTGQARGESPANRARRVIGAIVGLLLLCAAVWAVWSQRSVLDEALGSLRHAPAGLVLAAIALPLVGWLSTSAAFCLLSRRYAPVPFSDMAMLIGASWLLNHLPFRPGMVGRVAFHKKYHGMAIGQCIRVMLGAMGLTALSLVMLLAVAVAVSRIDQPVAQGACLAAPTLLTALAAGVARACGSPRWRELGALAARSIDMLSWVGRYAIVFSLIGEPLELGQLVAIAAVCQVAMVVPITGNGLGLREWAVGLTLASVAGAGLREQAAAVGLTADLVNRAAETLLAVPVGLACSWLLARKVRKASHAKGP